MTPRFCNALVLMSILCVAFGCSESKKVMSVDVVTALIPGVEFVSVETDRIENTDIETGAQTLDHYEARAIAGAAFGEGQRVAQFSDLAPGEYTVRVRLRKADGSILIERRTRVSMTDNYAMRVYLTRDCVGVACPAPAGSPGLTECLAGHCVDARCNPPATEFCPEVPFCSSATECGDTSACAMQNCIDGVCTPLPIANACENTTEYCNPDETSGGCEAYPTGDLDAGVPPDAGGIVCGAFCVPESTPCKFGYWECADAGGPETATCLDLQDRRAGIACGSGLTCDGMGNCN